MCFLRRFFTRRQLRRQVSQSNSQTTPQPQAIPSTNMFHRTGTVIINGGTLTMIVISKFGGSSSHTIKSIKYQTAPSIDAGNPNPPQEGVGATTRTTGSRTSDVNGVLTSQPEEGSHSGIRDMSESPSWCKLFVRNAWYRFELLPIP